VVGRIVFAAIGPVDFYLRGNFKADISGEVIQFRNRRFEDAEMAAHVIGDMESPQLGTVNLISFDPHPNLAPHPYVEWFSQRETHYRFELDPEDAWIVPVGERQAIDRECQRIREAVAAFVVQPSSVREESDWV
jgi:hypothetical protein